MKNDDSSTLFRLLVDFVYKENLTLFLNNKVSKNEAYSLLNWNVLNDKNNDGLFYI